MKLKFICAPASGNGGTETVLVKALNHLAKKHQVELFLTTVPENRLWLDNMHGVLIHEVKSTSKFVKLFYLVNTFISAKSNDHFIILGANTIKLAAKIRKVFKKKYKITSWIHYSLVNQNMFDPQNITLADDHWAISTPIKHQLMDLGIKEDKISLIFNPIDRYKGKVNIPDKSDTLRLVYVGKIMLGSQKNLQELFDGVKHYPNKIHVDLFGADDSNGEVQEYLSKLGIEELCTFHGWVKDPWKVILNQIHPNALVLTSKYEGLPMVMIEAMSRGIPCLVADFSGYEDIIRQGLNGIVYHSGNQENFVSCMSLISKTDFNTDVISDSIRKFNSDNYYLQLDSIIREHSNEKS